MERNAAETIDKRRRKRSNKNDTFQHIQAEVEAMKQKSFDAVRQKSRALAVLLCLAVLLLTGCGGGGAAAPEPPASAPAALS